MPLYHYCVLSNAVISPVAYVLSLGVYLSGGVLVVYLCALACIFVLAASSVKFGGRAFDDVRVW